MLPFIDRPISNLMVKVLRKRSKKIVEKALKEYIEQHHPDQDRIDALREALVNEMERVCAFSDKAIVRARIKQARLVFWLTAIVGTAITVGVAVFPLTTPLVVLFVPLMTAAVAWGVSVATVPYFYNERVKGAMVSSIAKFDKALSEDRELTPQSTELLVLRSLVNELREQNAGLTEQVQGLSRLQEVLESRVNELSGEPEYSQPSFEAEFDRNHCVIQQDDDIELATVVQVPTAANAI